MSDTKRILITDDDKFLLSMYSMKFEKSGFEVKIASSGAEALDTLRSGFKPDILLFDLIMPIMDGFAVYEAVKKEKLASGAIAIMLTNQGLSTDISRAKELGVAGYIIKATTIPSEVVSEVLAIYQKSKK